MANDTTMTYGNYQFSPVPMLNLTTEYFKTSDGIIIGSQVKAAIDGTLIPVPQVSGIIDTMTLRANLISAFQENGLNFKVKCGDNDLINTYPRINGPITFKPSSDNWVQTIPYSLELEFDAMNYTVISNSGASTDIGLQSMSLDQLCALSMDQLNTLGFNTYTEDYTYIKEASEDWSFEFMEDKSPYTIFPVPGVPDTQYAIGKLTHNVSAKGRSHYDGTGVVGSLVRPAWQEAKTYVLAKLDDIDNTTFATNVPLNHARHIGINETDGSYSVQESWTVVNNGAGVAYSKAIEDFTITSRYSLDSQNIVVSIDGSVQGLETKVYDGENVIIQETKYDAAVQGWAVVDDRLYGRCEWAYESMGYHTTYGRNLNIIPSTYTIGKHPSQGIITYNYEYNNRQSNCIAGSLSESITVNDNNPTDVIASLVVLGRKAGPVLQDLGTKTARTKDVQIEVVMPIMGAASCSVNGWLVSNNPRIAVYNTILCPIETALLAYDQVFITQNTESWNPKTGRYSRNVSWTIQACADIASPTACS